MEGERCKFILTSGDQRLHFKASSLDIKQDWVTALRTAILANGRTKRTNTKTSNSNSSSMAVTLTVQGGGGGGVQENGWTRDLRAPSPSPSATDVNTAVATTKSEFEKVSSCIECMTLCAVCECIHVCAPAKIHFHNVARHLSVNEFKN